MVLIEEELVDELCQTWDQLMESTDVQRLSYCITWLKYAKKHMRLHLWPVIGLLSPDSDWLVEPGQ